MPIIIKSEENNGNASSNTSKWAGDQDNKLGRLAYKDSAKDGPGIETYKVNFDVHVRPSAKIVRIPLFSTRAAIYDSLPIFPEVNILPLKGKNNQIKIIINSGIGEYRFDPIPIEPGDKERIAAARIALNIPEGEPMPYRSDDPPARFEIFRIMHHPRSYADFSNSLVSSIETRDDSLGQFVSAVGHIDRISPNVKYYYTFRALDIHGNISNPSPIYRVEIVDDNGAIYLLLENVELLKKEDTKLSKDMKKLFNIVPRMVQSIIDPEAITDYSSAKGTVSPKLGLEEETLWGKKFKIRLISKKTGKKMDLNINFKTEHIPEQIK